MSSTLFSHEGSEPLNHPLSSLDDLSNEGFNLDDIFTETTQQSQDLFPPQYLSGPDPFGSSQMTMYRNAADNTRLIPIFTHTPSPSSSYGTLSPSPSHESPLSPWSDVTTPSSDGSMSPMIPQSGLMRRESSASLGHRHTPSDSSFYLQPPAVHRHVRSRSESHMTRPVASQAMLEANQKRRRHDATHKCSECGQTFTAVFSLKRHMQSHSGVRPFVCNIHGCDQAFFNQSDCRRHERSRKRHKGLPHTFSDSP